MPSSPAPLPSWKQEVNRRLAEHKNRKGISVVDQDEQSEQHHAANSRAAAAAARVAARYAKAPSFSELQAAEARAALRAAEAATRAALEAQVAAQAMLGHIDTEADEAVEEDHEAGAPMTAMLPELDFSEQAHHDISYDFAEEPVDQHVEIRWEPDMPVRHAQQEMRTEIGNPWDEMPGQRDGFESGMAYDTVEAAQPIPANLIQFPREIVATRRMRPRLADSPTAETEAQQLSIFEVDPNSVSTEPMAHSAGAAGEPTWIGSSWQQIELDDQSQPLPDYYAIPAEDAQRFYQAPFERRILAMVVDTALILGLVFGVAALVAAKVSHLPGIRVSEVCAVVLTMGMAALYEWFFLTFAKVTPGMRYAQLSLCTFDEQIPTAPQVKGRLKAMLISVLPLGLGMMWTIFDEDQMSWHDRLSKTYLRLG